MVLIVDDDPEFLEDILESLGAQNDPLCAADARHARELIQSVGGDFSAALIDLDLPGENGYELIRELHAQFPELPIIAISGVVEDSCLEAARCVGASATLRKPVSNEWNAVLSRVQSRRMSV